MVASHGRVLLSVPFGAGNLAELLGETLLVLVLLHVLQVPFDLRLELVEWVALGLVLCAALLEGRGRYCVLSVRLLHVNLQVTEVVLEPVRRRLFQVNSHELQRSPFEFGELLENKVDQ